MSWRTDRKSTRLNSSHTEIYTLSLHDALPILDGDNIAGLAVLAFAGQHLNTSEGGVSRGRRDELEDVSLGEGAFLAPGVRDQVGRDHKNVWIVVSENRRRRVRRRNRIPRGVLAFGALLGKLALDLVRDQVLDARAEGRLAGWVVTTLRRGGGIHTLLVAFLQGIS